MKAKNSEIKRRKSISKILRFHYNNKKKYDNIKKCSELSYLFGVIWGDGCITKTKEKYGYRNSIQLGVMDKPFAIAFQKAVNVVFNNKPNINCFLTRTNFSPAVRKVYRIHFTSNPFAKLYHSSWSEIAKTFPREFINGFFDSEGAVHLRKDKRIIISARNTNYYILNFIKKLLLEMHIESSIHCIKKLPSGKYYYNLHIYNNIEFKKNMHFSIVRKQNRLNQVKRNTIRTHDYSRETYNKCLQLRKIGLTYKNISKKTGANYGSLRRWCIKQNKPRYITRGIIKNEG